MNITITETKRREFLKAHNDLRRMINTIHECHDIWMSDVGKLEHLQHLLHYTLKFTAPLDDEGNKVWWSDFVLEEEVPNDADD